MTYTELKSAVLDLGFDDTLDSKHTLVSSANRALRQINRIRPMTDEMVILQQEPVCSYDEPTSERYFSAEKIRSLSIEYTGSADLTFTVGDVETVVHIATPTTSVYRYQWVDPTDVELEIDEDDGFQILSMAFWKNSVGGVDSVPLYGKYIEYDLSAIASDFVDIASAPYQEDRSQLYEIKVDAERNKLYIPQGYVGLVKVPYHRAIHNVVQEDFDVGTGTVDVDRGLEDLVPILVASYVWLDDEPSKAQYYKTMFDQQMLLVRASSRIATNQQVVRRVRR